MKQKMNAFLCKEKKINSIALLVFEVNNSNSSLMMDIKGNNSIISYHKLYAATFVRGEYHHRSLTTWTYFTKT